MSIYIYKYIYIHIYIYIYIYIYITKALCEAYPSYQRLDLKLDLRSEAGSQIPG